MVEKTRRWGERPAGLGRKMPVWQNPWQLHGRLWSGLIDQWLRGCLTTRQRKNRGGEGDDLSPLGSQRKFPEDPVSYCPAELELNAWKQSSTQEMAKGPSERSDFNQRSSMQTFGPKCKGVVKRKEEYSGVQKSCVLRILCRSLAGWPIGHSPFPASLSLS